MQFVKSIAAAPAGLSGFIAVGDFNSFKAFADFAAGAVVRQAVNMAVVIGAINHAACLRIVRGFEHSRAGCSRFRVWYRSMSPLVVLLVVIALYQKRGHCSFYCELP